MKTETEILRSLVDCYFIDKGEGLLELMNKASKHLSLSGDASVDDGRLYKIRARNTGGVVAREFVTGCLPSGNYCHVFIR